MRNYSIKNTIWSNKGHELDRMAAIILDKKSRYYILGNNDELYEFYNRVGRFMSENILGYIGEKAENIGELNIVREMDINIDNNEKIVCTYKSRSQYEAMKREWTGRGFVENESFLQGEVFVMIYEVYAKDEIKIDRIEIFLTSLCTLNCEKCIAYVPYFKKPTITSLQQLKDDADLLFGKIDYVYKLKLLGGEVFLYPNLVEYVDYLHENYGDRIGTIRLGTNGTIFPSQTILEMCKRDDVTIDISDYSQAVPNMCMLDEVKAVCEECGVAVDVKRTGEQWLDMGFPNNIPEEKTEEQLRDHFQKCAMFCRQFSEGKYYFCCSNFAAVKTNMFPDDANNYFDFKQEFSKRELLEFELGFSTKGHTTFCNVCRGCSEEANTCHVEVAKQMNRGNRRV